jgi:hypothetical protein
MHAQDTVISLSFSTRIVVSVTQIYMHDITWIVCPAINKTWEMNRMHTGALQLTKSLAKLDTTWADSFIAEDRTISLEKAGTEEVYTGVSEGIVDIFHEIIDAHPQAIEHVTKDEESILHVAIRYRQLEIFRCVKEMELITKYRLASRIDARGYTILHHVADIGNYNGGNIAGPAFQLQDELKWFEVLNYL